MAGQVYAVASGKGGVGKTTTVVNLGVVLRRADHTVALVDGDLGMANLGTMIGVAGDATLHDVLAGEARVEEAIVEEAPGFGVLAGSEELTSYPDADPRALREVLETLASSYEYVLVDTGAGMSHEDVLPLGLADQVVLVTSPEPAAIGDTRKTAELAGLAEGDLAGLVITMADESTDTAAIAAEVDTDLLGVIPFDATVRQSTTTATPLEGLDPESPAATAYRELATTLDEATDAPATRAPAAAPAGGAEATVATEEAVSSVGDGTESAGDATEVGASEPEEAPESDTDGAAPSGPADAVSGESREEESADDDGDAVDADELDELSSEESVDPSTDDSAEAETDSETDEANDQDANDASEDGFFAKLTGLFR